MSVKVQLTGDLEALSVKAIEAFAKQDNSKESLKLKESMSAQLLVIAKAAFEAGDMTRGPDVWKAMTKHAERVYSEKHSPEGKPTAVSVLVPSWRVFKAQVSAGINAKLDPRKFSSVTAILKATPKPERKKADGSNGNAQTGPKVSTAIANAIDAFYKVVATVPPELETAAIEVIHQATALLGGIIEGKAKPVQTLPATSGATAEARAG